MSTTTDARGNVHDAADGRFATKSNAKPTGLATPVHDGEPETTWRAEKCAHCHLFVEANDDYVPGAGIAEYVHLHRGTPADEQLDNDHEAAASGDVRTLAEWKADGPVAMRMRFDDPSVSIPALFEHLQAGPTEGPAAGTDTAAFFAESLARWQRGDEIATQDFVGDFLETLEDAGASQGDPKIDIAIARMEELAGPGYGWAAVETDGAGVVDRFVDISDAREAFGEDGWPTPVELAYIRDPVVIVHGGYVVDKGPHTGFFGQCECGETTKLYPRMADAQRALDAHAASGEAS